MLRKIAALFISATMALGSFQINSVFADEASSEKLSEVKTVGKIVAFPGAEGGGMYATGARGAFYDGEQIEIYHVTNLNDSGAGSFRDAVSKGNRIIVFDVSGYIDLKSNINVGGKGGNLTILGQTAPGDGICFRGNNIKVSGENIILRYLRFRVGDKKLDESGKLVDTATQDGLEVVDDTKNVIIDHCSVSWGTDENLAAYAVKDVTIQNSIISEALNQSIHDKGEHSYAAIWGGVNLTVHHNLIATHKSRNPKIGTSETTAMTAGYKDSDTVVDIRNNVIYNWGDKAGYGAENGAVVNIINNYYKSGPSTPDDGSVNRNKRARIFEYSVGQKYQKDWSGKVYANGNYIYTDDTDSEGAKQAAEAVNANNYQSETGVYKDPKFPNMIKEDLKEPNLTYYKDYPIVTADAQTAYDYVLKNAGATLPKRDKIDERVINNVKERTAPNTNNEEGATAPNGGKKSFGLVDSPVDTIPKGEESYYDDRGYPNFIKEERGVDFDSDKDGIPDVWEDKAGLDKNNPHDSLNIGPNGYTWLEIYSETIGKNEINESIHINSVDTLGGKSQAKIGFTFNDTNNIKTVEFYSNGELVGNIDSFSEGAVPSEYTVTLPSGENYVTLKRINSDGTYAFSNTEVVYVYEGQYTGTDFEVTSEDGAVVLESGGNFCMYSSDGKTASATKNGVTEDFNFAADVSKISNLTEGAQTGVLISSGDKFIKVYRTYENKKLVLKADKNGVISEIATIGSVAADPYKASMIKVSKVGDDIIIQTGNSSATLLEAIKASYSNDFGSGNLSVSAYTTASAGKETSSIFRNIKFVDSSQITNPKIKVQNIENNQKLSFNEDVLVKVTPDPKAEVNEIAVFLGNNIIKDIFYEEGIKEEKDITIPISFSNVAEGELKVVCFDKNLGQSQDIAGQVVVSADITPWEIVNIGCTESDIPSYVQGTKDYTYKLYAPDGNISGASDKYGYMYQKVNDNMRFYYRVRPNASKNAGIMFKDSLDADGRSYFFGIEPNDTASRGYIYVLKAREEKGGEYKTIKSLETMQDDKYFIIVEKVGNKLNVYRTIGDNRNEDFYKTKELLAETEVSMGDEYYMGFAATSGVPDIGWTVIESVNKEISGSYIWNMDYGLDWWWQYPENESLVPGWTTESIGGNDTGKMVISTDSDYTVKGNIIREYRLDSGAVEGGFDIFITGEKPLISLNLQTESGQVYNVEFNSDNIVSVCDNVFKIGDEDFQYSRSNWYKVKIISEIGSGSADITLCDSDGNVISELNNISAKPFTNLKTVYNKNIPVKQGFFISPAANSQGVYYIDNAYVSLLNERGSLRVAISAAEKLKESDYSAKTWLIFTEALKKAKEVLAKEEASSEEIAAAREELTGAIAALEPIQGDIPIETKFWNFSEDRFTSLSANLNGTNTVDGLTLIFDSKSSIDDKSLTFSDGTSFTKRLKAGGSGSLTSKCFKFTVPGKAVIKVYATSANSTTRRLAITDGTNEQVYELTGAADKVAEYTYDGSEPKEITVYGKDGLNYCGISYTSYASVNKTTRITEYDKAAGIAKIYNGTANLKNAIIGIVVTDNNGKVVEFKKKDVAITAPLEEEQAVEVGVASESGNVKLFLWESLDTMKPLGDSFKVE